MRKPNFSEDFKRDAVHQIAVRGYAVREVSERLLAISLLPKNREFRPPDQGNYLEYQGEHRSKTGRCS